MRVQVSQSLPKRGQGVDLPDELGVEAAQVELVEFVVPTVVGAAASGGYVISRVGDSRGVGEPRTDLDGQAVLSESVDIFNCLLDPKIDYSHFAMQNSAKRNLLNVYDLN